MDGTAIASRSGTSDLHEVAARAADTAAKLDRAVLASAAVEVAASAPLRVLALSGGSDRLSWWSEPGLKIGGIGAAVRMEAEGDERFAAIRDGLTSWFDEAGAQRYRPLAFVSLGFSGTRPAGPWEDFAAAEALIPELEIVRETGGGTPATWLIASTLVQPAGAEAAARRLTRSLARGLTAVDLAVSAEHVNASSAEHVNAAVAEPATADREETEYTPDRTTWDRAVAEALGAIGSGALAKVVLARRRRRRAHLTPAPLELAEALAARYPNAFGYAIVMGDSSFVGASPELLVRLEGSSVRSAPAAGTVAGTESYAENRRLAGGLDTPKARLEQEIVADAVFDALQPFCDSIRASLPAVTPAGPVQHLTTSVEGRLVRPTHILDIAGALHPTPAVGGHPRPEAIELIARHEGFERGRYAGPIGVVRADGSGTLALALRGALIRPGEVNLFAGAGIVEGSVADEERAEVDMKLGVVGSVLSTLR